MWSVFFVFLSYLDRNLVKGDFLREKESKEMFSMLNGTFCAKMSTVGENLLYQVSDGAEVLRSVVSPAGKLVTCSVIFNQMQVKSFMHECRLGLKEQRDALQLDARFARMDEAKVTCREFTERSERSGGGGTVRREDGDESALQVKRSLKRSKRGFTYPGTLWCGAGNMADNYDQLGEFARTDSCCRIHDHCPHVIHAFSSKYGHTNFKWHSICHCDCDNALKDCLRKVNDTSSRVVGQAFFNVIGVPCFDFVYEEQCAERHWYGMCKRYEKLPIAVLRDAVPYDFGGIDVIDVLTLAPPKNTDSKKTKEEDKPETTTQSTMSGPEEPSLRNVVTAAEDFIKVLATVSTSQSSTTDSEKGETQSLEKKKRKNAEKKKKTGKKKKGKGKWRKRKQKAEVGIKTEEGAAVSTTGSKAEEANDLSNFISESNKLDQSIRDTNRVDDTEYELGGKDEPSNEVMKDEPAMDKETVLMTSPTKVQKKPAEKVTLSMLTSTTTVAPEEAKTRRLRKGGRQKSKKTPLPSSEELEMNTTDIAVPTTDTLREQQNFGSDPEKWPVVSTAKTPIVIPKVKRNRSKERGEREGREKRRKDGSASLIVAVPSENSSVDSLKVIPPTGAPTVPSLPRTERQVSHRLDIYGGKMTIQGTSVNSSFSSLKRQKSQGRGLRSRRRKTALPLLSDSALPFLPTPEASYALSSPTTAGGIRPTVETKTHTEWRLFSTITAAPSVITRRHRQTIRQQRKPRKNAVPAALNDRVSILEQTEQTPMTFTTATPKVTTAEELQRSENPSMSMSPVQLSIERVKAQFSRKKRRKAALSMRQQ